MSVRPSHIIVGLAVAATIGVVVSQAAPHARGTNDNNPHPDSSVPEGHTPVAICHSGNGKHYELIVVDDDSTILQGHRHHKFDIFVTNPAPDFQCPDDEEGTTVPETTVPATTVPVVDTTVPVVETTVPTKADGVVVSNSVPVGSTTTAPAQVKAEALPATE